jgi:hypothetical protein
MSERTAQAYMRLGANAQRVADLPSVRGALKQLTGRDMGVHYSDETVEWGTPTVREALIIRVRKE